MQTASILLIPSSSSILLTTSGGKSLITFSSALTVSNNELDEAIKKIKKEKILFNMMIHYELMHVDIILKAFPKSFFFNMVSNDRSI